MSSKSKSPHQRTNRAARGRSWMLVVTVVILLVATAAWVTVYTRAVATPEISETK